jgi:hypothetical protein
VWTFANPVVYTSSAKTVDLTKGSPSSWTVKDPGPSALKKEHGFKHPHSQLAPHASHENHVIWGVMPVNMLTERNRAQRSDRPEPSIFVIEVLLFA